MIYRLCFLFTVSFVFGAQQTALDRLMAGNKRYMQDKPRHPDSSACRREETLSQQSPYAIILGCSDSRVPPEIIFDEGVGDLFIVRVAGNVLGATELDSIEYAVKYLGSVLILVMGHQSCGAVTAVLQGKGEEIEAIADLIKPAIKSSKDVESAIKANVQWIVNELKKTPLVKKYYTEKKIAIQGAYYHLETGEVELLK